MNISNTNIIGFEKKSGTQSFRKTSQDYFGEKIMFPRITRASENGKYESMFYGRISKNDSL